MTSNSRTTLDDTKEPQPITSSSTSTVQFDGRTRYNWESLDDDQQDRVVAAIKYMGSHSNNNGTWEPISQPSTSQLWFVSSYHWNPELTGGRPEAPGGSQGEWCYHSDINFPMWHRIYIHIFEKMLQKADTDLGNDGLITLPYWRWDAKQTYPDDIWTDLTAWDSLGPNYWNTSFPVWQQSLQHSSPLNIRRGDPSQVQNRLNSPFSPITNQLQQAFSNPDFVTFSHGYNSFQHSVEKPHGTIHGMTGIVMSNPSTAAFDPVFFFHHCNVDRLYERYIKLVNTNSLTQFLNHNGGQDNISLTVPWQNRPELVGILNREYTSRDCFDLNGTFGNSYDSLDLDLPSNLTLTAPTYVIVPNVNFGLIKGSFKIIVFLIPNNESNLFKFNSSNVESNTYYAGEFFAFSGGKGCKKCESRSAITISVNVTHYLQNKKLSRHNVIIKCYLYGEKATEGNYVPLYLTHCGIPKLTGPIFEDSEFELSGDLNKKKVKRFLKKHKGDIKGLKIFLNKFGYYDGKIDNIYDNKTIEAVKSFQKINNLKITGLAGKILKKFILKTKRCGNLDAFIKHNKLKDEEIVGVVPSDYKNKKELTYTLINSPSYLKRSKVLEILKNAFELWSKALAGKLKFKYIDNKKNKDNNNKNKIKIDIEIDFNSGGTRDDKEIFLFDGEGGILGHGGNGYVYFDKSEKWETNDKKISDPNDKKTWYKELRPNISLKYVALHEIGHCLGLDHSSDYTSVMSPIYSPKINTLQKDDLKRIAELYLIN